MMGIQDEVFEVIRNPKKSKVSAKEKTPAKKVKSTKAKGEEALTKKAKKTKNLGKIKVVAAKKERNQQVQAKRKK